MPTTVLLCRCANTELTPAPVRETVLAALRRDGRRVVVVNDLCSLVAARDPALIELAREPLTVFACFPRAVRWLFDAAGAPLPDGSAVFNLRTGTAEDVLDAFAASPLSTSADDAPSAEESAVAGPPGAARWFPVIDYSRCRHCRQCANFCLFGVYSLDEAKKVRVARPGACKDNCPACARLCPHAAIMFPKYDQAPINGDEVTPENVARSGVGNELLPQTGGEDLLAALRARAKAAAEQSARETAPSDLPASVQQILDAAKRDSNSR